MTHKIILDTDPGIDDAMAILFAEAHPAIDLLAITTVFGNATIENGTRNALWLKQKYGMRAEVAQGAAAPLLREPVGPTTVVHGPSGLGDVEAGEVTLAPDPRPAWQYIVETVKANPGEITLVTIGPLTNLALALEAAPEITALVKQVVVMGGAFGVNGHRGKCDPLCRGQHSRRSRGGRSGVHCPLARGDHRAGRDPAELLQQCLPGCPAGRCR